VGSHSEVGIQQMGATQVSVKLQEYLKLTKELEELEGTDAPFEHVNKLLDQMDLIWYQLTDEEHKRLDAAQQPDAPQGGEHGGSS